MPNLPLGHEEEFKEQTGHAKERIRKRGRKHRKQMKESPQLVLQSTLQGEQSPEKRTISPSSGVSMQTVMTGLTVDCKPFDFSPVGVEAWSDQKPEQLHAEPDGYKPNTDNGAGDNLKTVHDTNNSLSFRGQLEPGSEDSIHQSNHLGRIVLRFISDVVFHKTTICDKNFILGKHLANIHKYGNFLLLTNALKVFI